MYKIIVCPECGSQEVSYFENFEENTNYCSCDDCHTEWEEYIE